MAKKVTGIIKLQIPAGQANPAPPVGPALGQHGVNIMGFCKEFNAATKGDAGLVIPVVITVYQDKSFTFSEPGIEKKRLCNLIFLWRRIRFRKHEFLLVIIRIFKTNQRSRI